MKRDRGEYLGDHPNSKQIRGREIRTYSLNNSMKLFGHGGEYFDFQHVRNHRPKSLRVNRDKLKILVDQCTAVVSQTIKPVATSSNVIVKNVRFVER